MQFAHEIFEATHASVVASKGGQSWLLFTGAKDAASSVLTAIGDALNLTGASTAQWTITLYYHQEVK